MLWLWNKYPNKIFKLDLRIREPMQICIHQKNNSPNPVNYCLTLKEGPKVKSDHIRRSLAHDILRVGFTFQASYINKQFFSIFKFCYPCLTLKEGSKVKSDHIKSLKGFHCTWITRTDSFLFFHIKRFPAYDF